MNTLASIWIASYRGHHVFVPTWVFVIIMEIVIAAVVSQFKD
jgi:predicted FMN-binding regulatory protein PaiB